MSIAGLKPSDIDQVAIATLNGHLINDYIEFKGWFALKRSPIKQLFFAAGSRLSQFRNRTPILEKLYYGLRQPSFSHRRRALKKILSKEFDVHAPVRFIDHHYAHACSAYFSSGFDDALVVTIDGGGDGVSSQVYSAIAGRLEKLHQVSSFDSLGNYYAYVTHICGFQAGKHEGKITGLAAHGNPIYKDVLDELITYADGTIVNRGELFFESALEGISSALPDSWKREDLAASIQVQAEDVTRKYISHWLEKTGRKNIALAGGLCANVRVNQMIHELPGVEQVFIHPGMTDEGLPAGAALARYADLSPDPAQISTRCLDDVYLGPGYSDEEIVAELESVGVEYEHYSDIEEEVANLLADGLVVARFNGRMEYGPRALGNRSILYNPADWAVNEWLNKNLQRTEFMPFAPSIIEPEAARCFKNLEGAERTARFMTITFDCTSWMKENCAGVVHIDGTARPQIVSRDSNPSFYRIIEAYMRKTGLPCVVNTSFNMHEEPIVCTPSDAIRAWQMSKLDNLAIGSFLVGPPLNGDAEE
jgi:carbamoyltransferase